MSSVFCSPVGRLELAQENVQTPGRFNAGNVQANAFALHGREIGGRYQGRLFPVGIEVGLPGWKRMNGGI
jgi:hypothetical protein